MFYKNISLKKRNTFQLDVNCDYFAEIRTLKSLEILRTSPPYENSNWFILGGGSNVLFTKKPVNPVVKVSIPGVKVFTGPGSDVLVKVGAGVVWHDLVLWTLENRIYGLENLSLIPGQVGAAPIQNIGAYGVELKDIFETLEVYNYSDGSSFTMDEYDCGFGYRSSIFKSKINRPLIITSVTFRLSRIPNLNLDYGDIASTLASMSITKPTPVDVSNAVISIRRSKLPDPTKIGNAGSFFKNPEIALNHYEKLKAQYPELPGYPVSKSKIKVPAGWLIDQLGWKGYRLGDAGVHANQALVLVNYGNAKGNEIVELSNKIRKSVKETYQIELQPEVNIV
jgi:UDP-N-acetylmuramate dehydrogenase